MLVPRRRFLGSSALLLGATLTEALATPLWKWRDSLVVHAAPAEADASPVQYIDVAQQAGLKIPNVWGEVDHKRIIIETKGSGLAFFDYDHDGWLDIYLTNGNRLVRIGQLDKSRPHTFTKTIAMAHFTDVTEKSGLGRTGWQTGVCVGDYNNDGWDDLFCCFWGHKHPLPK